MERPKITPTLVQKIERLLAKGIEHAVVAGQLRVTEYVVAVIAQDEDRNVRKPRISKSHRPHPKPHQGVDAATVRMIQRMLEVGMLSQKEIAREVGTSMFLVKKIALQQRVAVSTDKPHVFADLGERFHESPPRCGVCGTKIEITPCRICRARKRKISQESVW
jgi:hypothetical protein